MVSIKHIIGLSAVGVLAFGASASAKAEVVFNFNQVITGATPIGETPWATLRLVDTAPDQVRLTLTNHLPRDTDQFFGRVFLNLNNAEMLAAQNVDPKITGVNFGNRTNAGNQWNHEVTFNVSGAGGGQNRVKGGDSVSWTIAGAGISAANLLRPNANGWIGMVHVQGIGTKDDSGKIGAVPEPATMAALGLGLAAFARRRKRSK
jgi:hypothetical protein